MQQKVALRIIECLLCADILQGDTVFSLTWEEPEVQCRGLDQTGGVHIWV